MGFLPVYNNGFFGTTLRKTVLVYSFIMFSFYVFTFFNRFGRKSFILYITESVAMVSTISLSFGAKKNRPSILIKTFDYGYLSYMVFDVIIYCLSIYHLISAIFQGPDTLDKYFHINCKTNEVLFFSLLLISLLTIRFAIEIHFLIYSRSYLKQVNDGFKEFKDVRDFESNANSVIENNQNYNILQNDIDESNENPVTDNNQNYDLLQTNVEGSNENPVTENNQNYDLLQTNVEESNTNPVTENNQNYDLLQTNVEESK